MNLLSVVAEGTPHTAVLTVTNSTTEIRPNCIALQHIMYITMTDIMYNGNAARKNAKSSFVYTGMGLRLDNI